MAESYSGDIHLLNHKKAQDEQRIMLKKRGPNCKTVQIQLGSSWLIKEIQWLNQAKLIKISRRAKWSNSASVSSIKNQDMKQSKR